MLDLRGRAGAPHNCYFGLKMRLLFDEQLSETLVRKLAEVFPAALHVRLLDRGGTPDPAVWKLAREHGCVLVTKDADFHRLKGEA